MSRGIVIWRPRGEHSPPRRPKGFLTPCKASQLNNAMAVHALYDGGAASDSDDDDLLLLGVVAGQGSKRRHGG